MSALYLCYIYMHAYAYACSLTFNAAVSLVHAFMFSCLDYCSSIFAGLPGVWMEKLRRVHRATAQLIGGFKKFDHISQYMQDVLLWLSFPQRISYRIASLVWRCLSSWAPSYLCKLCHPLSSCAGCHTLRSSGPICLLCDNADTFYSVVVGSTTWNGLPIDLRHFTNGACSQFHHLLNTVLFRLAWGFSAWPGVGAPLSRDLEGVLYKY